MKRNGLRTGSALLMAGLLAYGFFDSSPFDVPRAYAASCTLDSTNLTTNGSMAGPGYSAPPYGIVAPGWTPFAVSSVIPSYEWVTNENANGDVAGTGAQYIWADTDAFDAGIYQTVSNLTTGVYYKVWVGDALAGFDPGDQKNDRNSLIGRQIGIDLTGGTNPTASSVMWGNVYWDGDAALNIPDLSLTFAAQTTHATLFVRVVNTNVNNGRSKAWFDVVCLEPLSPQPTPRPPTGPSSSFLPFVLSSPATCVPLTTIATVSVGAHPKGIAVDSTSNRVFVGLFDDSAVAVVDAASNQKLAAWSTNSSGHSNGVAVTGGRVFVTLRDSSSVAVLDETSGSVIGSQSVGSLPYGVGAANGTVWVANFSSNTVTVLDASTTNVIATPNGGSNPSLVAASTSSAFVSNFGGGAMEMGDTGSILHTYTATGAGSYGIAYNASANLVYVSNRNTLQISALDRGTGAVVNSVTLAHVPYALAYDPSSNHLFAVLADANQLDALDGTTLNSLGVLSIGSQGAQGGDGIAIMNGRVYVANNAEGTLSIVQDTCNGASAPAGPVSVAGGTVTLNAYPYESFQRDATDPTYNMTFKQFDAGAYGQSAHTAAPRTLNTLVLENEYLKLTFLPDLGGRLWQVLFKPTGQSLFYNNRVLKPSPWGPSQQGGWLAAGGMEWALPVDEHGYEWGIPWSYTVHNDPSGATVIFQDSQSSDRVRARVSVTLPTQAAYFVVHPRIENPTTASTRLQFWVNAALSLDSKNVAAATEFVLPASSVCVHSTGDDFIPADDVPAPGAISCSNPVAWPSIAGRNLSRYQNWDNYLGVFAADSSGDFAGAYNHANDLGVARVFPHGTAPGVKLFAFGPNFGDRRAFSDDGSDYFELWGGLPRSFFHDDDVALAAGAAREWNEYWIPFASTGGLSAATRKVVLYLNVDANHVATVGAAAPTPDTRGTLLLFRDNAEVARWSLSLDPTNPFRTQMNVGAGGSFRLRFVAPDGTVLAETN